MWFSSRICIFSTCLLLCSELTSGRRRHGFGHYLDRAAKGTLPPISLPPIGDFIDGDVVGGGEPSNYDVCQSEGSAAVCNNHYCEYKGAEDDFYCDCSKTAKGVDKAKKTHVGRHCEIPLDQTKCTVNKCTAGSTCYGTDKPVYDQYHHPDGTLADRPLPRFYRCFCPYGMAGRFCEIPEGKRKCNEDYCNHHGVISVHPETFECSCSCLTKYLGMRCEKISPCYSEPCAHGGECLPIANDDFRCICLQIAGGRYGEYYGRKCEHFSGGCEPCTLKPGTVKWNDCFGPRTPGNAAMSKGGWDELHAKAIANRGNICWNEGRCVTKVTMHVNGEYYTLPSCSCPFSIVDSERGLTVFPHGAYCEQLAGDLCELEAKKMRTDDTPPERMLDPCGDNGQCVATPPKSWTDDITERRFRCTCNSGWLGSLCDVRDPCEAAKGNKTTLCDDGVCVAMRGQYGTMGYSCICDLNQEIKNWDDKPATCKNLPADGACKKNKCIKGKGICFPCGADEFTCTARDRRTRNYKCLCLGRAKGVYCGGTAYSECDDLPSPCRNGGVCIGKRPKERGNDLPYACNCNKGYGGDFCERVIDACEAFKQACQHGKCVLDASRKRRFRCECKPGFRGIDCELPNYIDFYHYYNDNINWMLPLFLVPVVALMLSCHVYSESKKKAKKLHQVELDNEASVHIAATPHAAIHKAAVDARQS